MKTGVIRNVLSEKERGNSVLTKWAPPKGTITSADFVSPKENVSSRKNRLLFYHRNPEQTVFDVVVAQQGMDGVKSQMMNPLKT